MPNNQLTARGLLSMTIAILILVAVVLFATALTLLAGSLQQIDGPWLKIIARGVPACGVAAQVMAVVGFLLCLTSPREVGRKGWLIGAAVLFGLAILVQIIEVLALASWNDEFAPNAEIVASLSFPVQLLDLAGLACLLVWLRSVALYLHASKPAKQAMDLLKTGAVIFVVAIGAVIWMVVRHADGQADGRGPDQIQLGLGFVLIGMLFAVIVWLGGLASLLVGLRRALLDRIKSENLASSMP